MPEPPVVTIDEESNAICILPYDEIESPPDLYRILAHDITRETIFEANITPKRSMNSEICVSILKRPSSMCAPLLVSVSASNKFGEVDTVVPVYSENGTITGDVCSCIHETGILTINFI